MRLVLKNANDNRNKVVEVNIHDKVKIIEWDSITAEGIVKSIEKNDRGVDIIEIHHGRATGGCYDCVDYSYLENETTFTFEADQIYEMKVANFQEEFTPLSLLHKALRENYCGSEEIVMSPMFFKMYQHFMKEKCDRYAQYPIRVDESLEGYVVVAVPNEESKKHKVTPKECYTIQFYQSGKWKGSRVFSAFNDELESEIDESAKRFKKRTGIRSAAYKLQCNQQTVKRGVI